MENIPVLQSFPLPISGPSSTWSCQSFIRVLTYSFDRMYWAPLCVSPPVLSVESLIIGEYRWAWPDNPVWDLGRDEVDRFGRPSGSGKGPSDLWIGSIILGLGTVICGGWAGMNKTGDWETVGVAAFCVWVYFSLTRPLFALGEEADRRSPLIAGAGGAVHQALPPRAALCRLKWPGAVKVHIPEGIC